jgi:flagellar motor switch protein FliN
MSGETPVPVDPQAVQLRGIWVECFGAVLAQVAGFPVTVEPSDDAELSPKGVASEKPPVCMIIAASKALQGDMAILASEPGALALAQVLTSEQLNAAVPFDKDHLDAYEELLRQVLGQVATSLKRVAEGEVVVKPSRSEAPAWTGASRLGIRITGEKLQPIHLALLVSPELARSLQPRPAAAPLPAAAPSPSQKIAAASAAPTATTAEPASPPGGGRSSNLELLLDIKLDATIRFGQKHMLLREILELHPGTAVALDRQVQEPVELLVGGRVVAQGDVVIVDGNYGIRITEILSPLQRIESLGKTR